MFDGRKEYPNPMPAYHYTPEDVSLMGKILDEYIDDLIAAEEILPLFPNVWETVLKINTPMRNAEVSD